MSKIFSYKLSSTISMGTIAGVILIIAVYMAYRIGEIQGKQYVSSPQQDVSRKLMRVPLFVHPDKVHYEPRFNFTFDSINDLHAYRVLERLDHVVQGSVSEFDMILKLLHWTRNQWEPGRPDPYPPINAMLILQEIRAGRTGGHCAQYDYVFVQALQSFGIKARYVTVAYHEVAEAWVKEFNKWICFDPLLDSYYTDNHDIPLSVYEIYSLVRHHKPVKIIGNHSLSDIPTFLQKFTMFAIWLKNNHISSPINFIDLDYFKVFFVESLEDTLDETVDIPEESLVTSSPSDLYFDPEKW